MGTRGAYGFRINGKDKITYNHYDSYPSYLGSSILGFIEETPIEDMKSIAEKITLIINQDAAPSEQDISRYKDFMDLEVSKQSEKDWYCLLRKAQGNLNIYKNPSFLHMIDNHDFLLDSLFCEWAYIINLDEKALEIYTGFNKNRHAKGRYASGKDPQSDKDYYGVALVVSIPLSALKEDKEGAVKIVRCSDFSQIPYGKETKKEIIEMLGASDSPEKSKRVLKVQESV